VRNRFILIGDVVVVAIAAFGAFALRFDLLFPTYRPEFWPFLAAVILIKPAVLYAFGMYQRYWRYASLPDILALLLAVSSASAAVAIVVVVAFEGHYIVWFSRSVVMIDWLLTLLMTGGIRMAVRIIGESRAAARGGQPRLGARRVLIAGAGEAGAMVVREMRRNPQLGMVPVGFIDDDPVKRGKRIHGVPVLGSIDKLSEVVASYRIDEVVVAMPTAPGTIVRNIANSARAAGVTSKTIPGVFEIIDGQVSMNRLRNIDIGDLLRRAQVVGESAAFEYLRGRSVLVTGAGGSIGFELCRQVAKSAPSHMILVGHGENSIFEAELQLRESFPGVRIATVIADIRDPERLRRVFNRYKPSVVFHAAAHKHVPLMELNPEEAVTNNVVGTRNVVDAAMALGIERLVMISSDKAVAPSSIMGATKRVAEAVVRDGAIRSGRAFAVVRFGNVLASRGSVVTLFKRQIEAGGPVTVTHADMKRFFMTIPEAVHLVLQAGSLASGGELFVLDMGEPVKIVDLAEDVIRLSGFSTDQIPIVITGTRPGEKLEELLVDKGETTESTKHPEVLRVVETGGRPPAETMRGVQALYDAASRGDREAIEMALVDLVPTFTPAWLRDQIPS
jgi:FlaA1/EpsC-like NDP-sugar epimerase